MKTQIILLICTLLWSLGCSNPSVEPCQGTNSQCSGPPQVTAPPKSLKLDGFYKKYLDCQDVPIVSSESVADAALVELGYLVRHVLFNRPDILKIMAKNGVYFVVIGAKEQVTDIPEYSHMDPWWNRRARGFGDKMTSCGEENLLNYPGDRYVGENIFIHEFAHSIHKIALRRIDKDFNKKLKQLYKQALAKGMWKRTYAAVDSGEYWAEGVQSWFDCNRQSRDGKANGVHNHVNTREELEAYDADLAKLIAETLGPTQWRYRRPAERKGRKAKVTATPKSLKVDPFYKKYVDCKGLPITSSERVADAALLKTDELINKLLAGRDDIRKAMIDDGVRFVIIGANEVTTDIPEYSNMKPKEYWDERARGFGGRMTSCGEENLLCLPVDRYDDENILVHEFGGHCVHRTLRLIDKEFNKRLKQLYDKAIAKGLWKYTYAGTNRSEYWAEGVQSYFDCNRERNWNHNHVNTREELEAYDPDLAKFIAETLRVTKETDWRYKPVAQQPQVTTPPKSLKCDPFYKKYVYCRSLPILGSERAVDAALLEANYLIRNMFTYRHDILKPMMDAGVRLVVLGEKEQITDIPECRGLKGDKSFDRRSRWLSCTVQRPLIVCGQENLLHSPKDKYAGENILIKEFARAAYLMTGLREIDEDFESRRHKQQYELYGVERMDKRFDAELKKLYETAMKKGLWKNTLAAKDGFEYWAEGVQCWFNANRQNGDNHNYVNTREELESYDPALAKLVAKVFRHTERVDWRYQRPDKRK